MQDMLQVEVKVGDRVYVKGAGVKAFDVTAVGASGIALGDDTVLTDSDSFAVVGRGRYGLQGDPFSVFDNDWCEQFRA